MDDVLMAISIAGVIFFVFFAPFLAITDSLKNKKKEVFKSFTCTFEFDVHYEELLPTNKMSDEEETMEVDLKVKIDDKYQKVDIYIVNGPLLGYFYIQDSITQQDDIIKLVEQILKDQLRLSMQTFLRYKDVRILNLKMIKYKEEEK